jgi:hypothetical protein
MREYNPTDSVVDILRKICFNQDGVEVPLAGDGERELWRKILINQAAQISSGGQWTTP